MPLQDVRGKVREDHQVDQVEAVYGVGDFAKLDPVQISAESGLPRHDRRHLEEL